MEERAMGLAFTHGGHIEDQFVFISLGMSNDQPGTIHNKISRTRSIIPICYLMSNPPFIQGQLYRQQMS